MPESETTSRLIGIHGRRGAGKDTVFDFIRQLAAKQHKHAVRRAFADPLKVSAARALGFDGTTEDCVVFCNALKEDGAVEVWTGTADSTEPYTITGREYLQRYGTEAHREVFGDNFWVDAILPLGGDPVGGNHWSKRFDRADIAVVTDVRFENEAERILDLGGEVWRIHRPEADNVEDVHASEIPLPERFVTLHLLNGGGLDDLERAVYRLVNR